MCESSLRCDKPGQTSETVVKSFAPISAAFWQAEKVVGLLAIGLRLQILVAETADGHDHFGGATASANVEAPLATHKTNEDNKLRDLPRRSVAIAPSDVGDALM